MRWSALATIATLLSISASAFADPKRLSYDYDYTIAKVMAPSNVPVHPVEWYTTGAAKSFGRIFPFKSNCSEIPPVLGTCVLFFPVQGGLDVTENPLMVVIRSPVSFAFKTLPGHIEGPNRYVMFHFYYDEQVWTTNTFIPYVYLRMRVIGSGEWSAAAYASIKSRAVELIWDRYAQSLRNAIANDRLYPSGPRLLKPGESP